MSMSDEEVQAKLLEARDNIILRITEITATPKPSYEIDGQKVSWTEYLKQLTKSLEDVKAQIADNEGPTEQLSTFYL